MVHKKQIFNQWLERIESFLSIPKKEIGQLCATKKQIGKQVTVAMVQTLSRTDLKDICNKFGTVLVDECHHMPARMFRAVIKQFNPYYLYGLTATPERKFKDDRLTYVYLGEILSQIESNSVSTEPIGTKTNNRSVASRLKVIIRKTDFNLPFKITVSNSQLMLKMLTFDTARNSQICSNILIEARAGSKCLVLTERRDHADVLTAYLSKELETITLTGELTEKRKSEKLQQIDTGHFQVIIATGQLLGEGTDIGGLDSLFLVYPFSFHGKLTQYIGRITCDFPKGTKGKIYDYRDFKIGYLDRIFRRRKAYYDKNNFKVSKN